MKPEDLRKELEDTRTYLDRARSVLIDLERALPVKMIRLTASGSMDASSSYELRGLLAYRMHSISDAAIRMLEEWQGVPGLILARAAVETAVIMFSLHSALEGFLAGARDYASYAVLSDYVLNTTLATREPNWDERFQARNILTLVGKLEKRRPGFMKEYETLSEYAHPNLSGVLSSFGKHEANGEFRFGEFNQSGFVFGVVAMERSLRLFWDLHEAQTGLLEEVDRTLQGRPSVLFE